ncbi:Glucosamine-6-phosphate deaminase [Dyella terrae]|nr:Glucosamine-6-phosphate deaminase [Dyella terrae]
MHRKPVFRLQDQRVFPRSYCTLPIMSDTLDVTTHSFTDCDALAVALAERIADRLREGIAQRGSALLAVSGGSTPRHFFEKLSRQTLDWSKVQVTLVDERWVPESNERSNAAMVKALLLQHAATTAQFVPLYTDAPTPEAGLATVRARVASLELPFDAVILGMGNDGHTASFSPKAIACPRRWTSTTPHVCCQCARRALVSRGSPSRCLPCSIRARWFCISKATPSNSCWRMHV